MYRSTRPPIELAPGSRLADAVIRGAEAFDQGDAARGDEAYCEAVALTPGDDPMLWSRLAADHVEGLRSLGCVALALQRCDEYLRHAGGDHIPLRLLRAETRALTGDRAGVDEDLDAIPANVPDAEEEARRRRLEGLSAAMWGRLDEAKRHLGKARRAFLDAGDQCGVDAVDRDLRKVGELLRGGDDGPPPETVSDHLLRAKALRDQWRYEEAIHLLRQVRDRELDPALRFPVLYELVVLYRLVADHAEAERLLPSLREAALSSPNPMANRAAVDRVARPDALGGEPGTSHPVDEQLQRVRRLIANGRLDEAAQPLRELSELVKRDHEIATWHLAAGELALARGSVHAIDHLRMAAERSIEPQLVDIRVRALRLLGDAHAQRARVHAQAGEQARARVDDQRAAERWAEAHHLEEQVAARQVTDATRVRMLHAVPDEHDQRIRVAATALEHHGPEAAATVVVAMEAARGAAILGRILPGKDALVRALPSPSDQPGAWRWVEQMSEGFPRAQVAWLLHSTPDRVHHALVGQGLLSHVSVPCDRDELNGTIDSLVSLWSEEFLETSVEAGYFDRLLANIASLIGVDAVIPQIPERVCRIAVVAGGALSDIPFAAVRFPRDGEPIGLRYALSDLPCLSARRPLDRRSRRLRGLKRLVVSPPVAGIAPAQTLRGDTPLEDAQATRHAMHDMLKRHRHRRVRIDSHGAYDPDDPTRSWLQLAPDTAGGPNGRLEAEELRDMDLCGCGTLVLGACESGMAQRIGRDERIGFARAAFHAGAASVVAARWVAAKEPAAAVLDGFDRYARYLPRDLALQRAQLDVLDRVPGDGPGSVAPLAHPSLWACWTLYGDSGFQTRAGRARRWLYQRANEWRQRAARS